MDVVLAQQVFQHSFPELTLNDWQQLAAVASEQQFAAGEVLLHEGDYGQELYFILSGEVVIQCASDKGEQLLLNYATAGQIIGELAMLNHQPRSATVTALESTRLISIDIQKLAQNSATQECYLKIMRHLASALSQKIIYQNNELVHGEIPDVGNSVDDMEAPNSILVLFGWRWSDIMHEVPFLAEHGYDAIKLSPLQESVVRPGDPWWSIYQPVSYHLNSRFGTLDDLTQLIDFCHEYHLKVYVDLVLNHMAEFRRDATEGNCGSNGSIFTNYHYKNLNNDHDQFTYDDFYHYVVGGNRQISDDDYATLRGAWHLEHYDFLHLPKLDLKNPHVVMILRKYLKFLLELGVDGFRLDAAKHLSIKAVEHIFHGLKTKNGRIPFIYQEYYASAPFGIDLHSFMLKYFKLGYVTSFKYGEFLADAITNKNNNLQKLIEYSFGSSWIHYPENRTVTVIDNHDTERMMPNMLNFRSNDGNAYVLAYIFMLAWPFGVPKIMSSFKFLRHDDAIPREPLWQHDRFCLTDQSLWVAQHRWYAIANMVLFHRRTAQALGIAHVWLNGNQIAFARVQEIKNKAVIAQGFVVINATGESLTRRFETGLPAGKYYNLIVSNLTLGKFSGPLIVVERYGKATITVPPFDAVVLLLDAQATE